MTSLYRKSGRRYLPASDLAHLEHFDQHSLLIAATRYYMGRRTIQACCFAQHELARAWPQIPEQTRNILKRDIEEAFQHDDDDRHEGRSYRHLGDDCDRSAWEHVRRHWKKEQAA